MTYAEKMRQANREARFAVIALVATIAVWVVLGFGLEGCGITLLSTPLWVLAGCFGTWIFAILVAVAFSRLIMKDCDLDDEDAETVGPSPTARASQESIDASASQADAPVVAVAAATQPGDDDPSRAASAPAAASGGNAAEGGVR